MIQVDQHEGSYLSICKHYRAIYDTPCILEDSSKWQQVHGVFLVFCIGAAQHYGCRRNYKLLLLYPVEVSDSASITAAL